jgi:predicted ferric reductase
VKKISFTIIALLILAIPCAYWIIGLAPASTMPVFVYDFGRLCALVVFVLIFFQYLLSARIKWTEKGIGLDRMLMIHKRSGLIVLFLILGHPLLMNLSERWQGFSSPFHVFKLLGLVTLLLLVLSAGAALLYERLRLKYEVWKSLHKAGYALYPLAFAHSFLIGGTVQEGPVRILWILLLVLYACILCHKALRRRSLRRRPFNVAEVRKENPSVCTVFFEGDHGKYKPGQFMMLQLKRNGVVSEPHPFTISSSPTSKRLSVTIKDVGDFTSTVNRTRPSEAAYIDMPYGVFSFLSSSADSFVFIAGGIGITPFMSMLRYMRDRKTRHKVVLLWANRAEEDILFKEELAAMEQENSSLKIVHVLSRQDSWEGEKGHVDSERLKKFVSDFGKPVFFICGPPAMMRAVKSALRNLGIPAKNVRMERFALR